MPDVDLAARSTDVRYTDDTKRARQRPADARPMRESGGRPTAVRLRGMGDSGAEA